MGGGLRALEEKIGLPPLREVTKILSGDSSKRIEALLGKLEKLGENRGVLVEAIKLMEMVHAMAQSGELDKLESILKSLPKGKSGENMVAQVKQILDGLEGKIEKLTKLAQDILSK